MEEKEMWKTFDDPIFDNDESKYENMTDEQMQALIEKLRQSEIELTWSED